MNLRSKLAKATRRPWSVDRGVVPSVDGVERVIIQADHRATLTGGYAIANCGPVGEYGSDNDAQLIVDAVNGLDAILDVMDEAMHMLCYVDAHMNERVAVAEKLAKLTGHQWPPYPDAKDEDDDEDADATT